MAAQQELNRLLQFAIARELIAPEDLFWSANALIDILKIDSFSFQEAEEVPDSPTPMLQALLDDAVARGVLTGTAEERDLMDTRLMGVLTPQPSRIIEAFRERLARSPQEATSWLYRLESDANYIRQDRMARNLRWKTPTEYGELDITINLSKPEKDPRDIAAARSAPGAGYPQCLLCRENEGYAGRAGHPARQNLRMVPMDFRGRRWYFQYSPYGYYNEHCIILNERHSPMKISRETFENLIDFLDILPHYFAGSNADLPIVGGSILSHDHYQGGRYIFPMEKAPVEQEYPLAKGIAAARVRWPLSVLRITGPDAESLIGLASHILDRWRDYSDQTVGILAESQGTPHNTLTPIARKRGRDYEFDLVLRNNRTSEEHPLGIFHPHAEVHHIKKENIGLIEVMGLAVLPPRLKDELEGLQEAWRSGAKALTAPELEHHAPWYQAMRARWGCPEDKEMEQIVRQEVGQIFLQGLHDAGVFKRDSQGRAAFDRFVKTL